MAARHPLLRLEGVSRAYTMGDETVWALHALDLAIDEGDFVAVMGASGSGKSTLMNVLGFLDRPDTGTYYFAGHDTTGFGPGDRATLRNQQLGFVFQSFNLLPRTSALENVELPLVYAGVGAAERTQRATEALERVGLGKRLHHHPNQMSGGQMQRVAIARALVTRPRLVLADEPTGNLDSKTSLEVMGLLQSLGQAGITVVLVTHEPDIAEYASRVIVMRDGRVTSDRRQTPKAVALEGRA
jgi:putative ABC transport system ATP-binding protein